MHDDKPGTKPKKETFLEGMENRLREAAGLGRVLVQEPRAFPGAAQRTFKRFVRGLWEARGGGMYACGFVVTFLWLEAATLVNEVATSGSFASFLSEEIRDFILRFTVQSLENTILAFIWPAWFIMQSPILGAASLAALWLVFPRFIKPTVTRWLFDDDEEGAREAKKDARG